jgi:hypothetical protein
MANRDLYRINNKANNIGAKIFFGDKAGIHTEAFHTRAYAPCALTAVIPTTGSLAKVKYYISCFKYF